MSEKRVILFLKNAKFEIHICSVGIVPVETETEAAASAEHVQRVSHFKKRMVQVIILPQNTVVLSCMN